MVVVAVDEHSADTYANSYFYGQNGNEWYVVRCKYYAFDVFYIFAWNLDMFYTCNVDSDTDRKWPVLHVVRRICVCVLREREKLE